MKTKDIMKTLALPLMAVAAMMTTSCSSEDNVIDPQPAAPQNTIHVTLNAEMADDASTRAIYGYGAADAADRKVTIQYGDKLHVMVKGPDNAWTYYGILNNTSEAPSKFSGDLSSVSGTYDGSDIITASKELYASLLPKGYSSKGFLTDNGDGTITNNYNKPFADGDFSSGVPLVSENDFSVTNAAGYAKSVYLSLTNAVLCFTVSGLSNGSHNVTVSDGSANVSGTTTATSNTATFSVGMGAVTSRTYTLSIDGYEPINLGTKLLVAGHLYKISRTAVPIGAINGQFSVSSTKKVYFAKGNLQAVIGGGPTNTYNYTASSWKFADHQYDFIGDAAGNTTFAVGTTVDLFGWVGASATYDTYGLCTNDGYNNEYYGTVGGEALKTDWGSIPGVVSAYGSGWRTLTGGTGGEWEYLLNTRSASTVNGTADARYCKATVAGVNGLVIFPDSYKHPAGATAPASINTSNANYSTNNNWTVSDWTAMEAAGAVFLPEAGRRSGKSVGGNGQYWSSTPVGISNVNDLYFDSYGMNAIIVDPRDFGESVRLVKDAN